MEHLGSEDRSELEFKVHRLLAECFRASHLKDSLSIRKRGKWWNLKLSVKVRLCVCSSPLSIKVILRQWLRWETVTWSLKDTSVQFSSVAQSHPTLWDLINCSTPGFPVHQILELKQGQILPSSQVIYSMWTPPMSTHLENIKSGCFLGLPWQSVKTALLLQETPVWSLLGELRSGILQGAAKNKKQEWIFLSGLAEIDLSVIPCSGPNSNFQLIRIDWELSYMMSPIQSHLNETAGGYGGYVTCQGSHF